MPKSILHMEAFAGEIPADTYRTIFKNQHGRLIYLSLENNGTMCTITDCFYTDRGCRSEANLYKAKPKKLTATQFPVEELLRVIETQLDKKFYGMELEQNSTYELPLNDYLDYHSSLAPSKYRFLIMQGSGESINGLPSKLRTRLKNKLHRTISLELEYYKDGSGVVRQCYYCDRSYLRKDLKVTPPLLISCFFPYTREGILKLLNNEICCNFTHIIVTDGTEGIDLDSSTTPICGSV